MRFCLLTMYDIHKRRGNANVKEQRKSNLD